jgi:uncharacterized repeat protein (TIGR01451 family)
MGGLMGEISRRVSALPSTRHKELSGVLTNLPRLVLVVIPLSCAFVALSLLFTVGLQAAPPDSTSTAHGPANADIDQVGYDWTRRVKLTFTNTAQTQDLVGFPVLVVLDSGRIDYAYTGDAGQDIRFVDADGTTVLAHEIERWDGSGTSYVWVRVPRINHSSNTDYIWMYYGNPDASDGQDPANVFTDTYRMVYHLEEDPNTNGGVIRDSTANGFHGANQGTADAPGFIGNALEFGGCHQFVNLGTDLAVINHVSATTLSAWIRPDSISGDGDILALGRYNGGFPVGLSRASIVRRGANVELYARSRDDDRDFNSIPTTSHPLSADTWHYVVAVVDYSHDAVAIYVDGAPQPTAGSVGFDNAITPDTNSANCAIGSNDDGTAPYFDGFIDEVRVAAAARTPDWIAAQYLSMTDAFIAFGAEEDINVPVLGLYAWASRDEVYIGSRLDYSLLVRNLGGSANQLVISDTLPAHTTFGGCSYAHAGWLTTAGELPGGGGGVSASFSCGLEGDKVVWRIDEMEPDRLFQLSFWVTVDTGLSDGAVIVNDSYAIVADRLAPLAFNQPVTSTVREVLVSVTNDARPNPVTVGQQLQFTITVRNKGSLLENVTVTDRLPSGVSFLGCGGTLCELEDDESEVRWWMSSVPTESEQPLTVRVAVDSMEAGLLINEHYGAWIPAASQSVMGAPVTVHVSDVQSETFRLCLPLVLSGATP